jgi:hypothetical protein
MFNVDGNENNGNTLKENLLMSNEDEDHCELFEFLCIFQFTSKNSKLFGVPTLFDHKRWTKP